MSVFGIRSQKKNKVLPPPLPLEIPIGGIATDQVSHHSVLGQLTYGFGYDRLLDDYKIVTCSVHYLVRSDDISDHIPFMEFQVYALGTNTWRKISTDNNPYKSLLSIKSVVFVNGALHWIMSTSDWYSTKSLGRTEAKIVAFDIEKEVFREIQTPSMLIAKFKRYFSIYPIIQVLKGCLCVMEHESSTETCNVWMMMDYGVKESWTKLFTIFGTQDSHYDHQMSPTSCILLRFCENGTEILVVSSNSLIVFSLINNTARCVKFGKWKYQSEVYIESTARCVEFGEIEFGKWRYQSEVYIESLVSLNSGVYNQVSTSGSC